jgi:hypothetical protein
LRDPLIDETLVVLVVPIHDLQGTGGASCGEGVPGAYLIALRYMPPSP